MSWKVTCPECGDELTGIFDLCSCESERGADCVALACCAHSTPERPSNEVDPGHCAGGGDSDKCPFCGSMNWQPDTAIDEDTGEIRWHFIYCYGCHAMGPLAKTEPLAIEAFKRRRLSESPENETPEGLSGRRNVGGAAASEQ